MADYRRTPAAYRRDLFLARQVIGQLRDQALESGDVFHVGIRTFDAADLDVLWDGLDRVDSHFWHLEEGLGGSSGGPGDGRPASLDNFQGPLFSQGVASGPPLVRDENLRRIRKVGRKRWKQESGYHRRSLAETAMFRVKTIFGSYLQARKLPQQKVEAKVKCAALNRMTHLGMPDSYRVA